MKLPLKHRCPWCGEIVKDIRSKKDKYRIQKCSNCEHEYTYHENGAASKISAVMIILLLLSTVFLMFHISIVVVLEFLWLITETFVDKIISYERYDDDDIRYGIKKYRAKFTFEHDDKFSPDYIKTRIFLSDKAIIPICFADENDKPLSHVICISMEDTRRITYTKYECVFTFLPNSAVSYDASKTCDFYLFDGDKKRVGKGRIMAEYSKFI